MSTDMRHYAESDIVIINAGKDDDQTTFRVHKDILLAKSPYFQACLSHGFEEGQTNCIELTDHDPLAVGTFVTWLYTDRVDYEKVSKTTSTCQAYSFARYVCTDRYHNAFMDAVQQCYCEKSLLMNLGNIRTLYDADLSDSPLARFGLATIAMSMATNSACWVKGGVWHKELDSIGGNFELMRDLHLKVLEYKAKPYEDPSKLVGCHYHLHTDTECVASKKEDTEKDKAGK